MLKDRLSIKQVPPGFRAGARAACAFAYGESFLILSVNTGRIGSQGLFNRCIDNARNLVVPSRQISQHGRESEGASNRAQISARAPVARNRRWNNSDCE